MFVSRTVTAVGLITAQLLSTEIVGCHVDWKFNPWLMCGMLVNTRLGNMYRILKESMTWLGVDGCTIENISTHLIRLDL